MIRDYRPGKRNISKAYRLKLKAFGHLKRIAFFLVGSDRLNIFALGYIRMSGMKKRNYLLLFFIIILSACHRQPQRNQNLLRAEQWMQLHPDSALALLDSMGSLRLSDESDYALYHLLRVQAEDKLNKRHDTDSLIKIAVRYFDRQDDPHRKAQAWYYMGRVHSDMLRLEKALLYYKIAEKHAAETTDYRLQSLIYNHSANLLRSKGLLEEAYENQRMAYYATLLSGDSAYLPYMLNDLGRIFLFKENKDSALYYFRAAGALAEQLQSDRIASHVLSELGVAYRYFDNPDSAFYYLRLSIEKGNRYQADLKEEERKMEPRFLALGNLFLEANQIDSAIHYLSKSLKNPNYYTKASTYLTLAQLEERRHNYRQALEMNKIYLRMKDSLEEINRTAIIAEIRAKYDNERLKSENRQILLENVTAWRNIYLIISVCLLTVFGLGTLFYFYKKRKEQQIKSYNRRLLAYHKMIRDKERQLKRNTDQIHSMQQELPDNDELMIKDRDLRKSIDMLKAQISALLKKQQRIKEVNEQLEAGSSFIDRLKIWKPGDHLFTDAEWRSLPGLMDIHFDGFATRLKQTYPELKPNDIKICCMLKLGFTNQSVAELLGCKYESLLTQRTRIKKQRMRVDTDLTLEQIIGKIG